MLGRASTPEGLAQHLRRIAEDEVIRARQAVRWPLSADELARRAEHDRRPMDWSWQDGAADRRCPDCCELGRACAGHLGLWASEHLSVLTDCEVCGGRGRTMVEEGAVVKWRACPACNAAPVHPGFDDPARPSLALRAWPSAPRRRETWAERGRAKGVWARYRRQHAPAERVRVADDEIFEPAE